MGLTGKLMEVFLHPEEAVPLGKMYLAAKRAKKLPKSPTWAFCYDMLNRVSRSFAIVIQQLPEELRNAVCVFYLVLRGLDTVEDDMALNTKKKLRMLETFCDDIYDRTFVVKDCGEGNYKTLMLEFNNVTEAFLSLDQGYQDVIYDITKRMGHGMRDFIPKEVETVEDYNLYCHYVAGLVGIGLSKLFAACELESPKFASKMDGLANDMGLFLQKTNIIRDYLEDYVDGRAFWPKTVWSKHATTGDLGDFTRPCARLGVDKACLSGYAAEVAKKGASDRALACLDELIADALELVPDRAAKG